MPALIKFNSFTSELGKGTHNFSTHTLKLAFTNTAPTAANTVLTDITQIAASGGYTTGGMTMTGVGWTTSSGVATLSIADYIFTASGSVGPFRYLVLYNDTPTSPVDPLIGYYDYGSALTLATGESLTVDFDGVNGVLSVA